MPITIPVIIPGREEPHRRPHPHERPDPPRQRMVVAPGAQFGHNLNLFTSVLQSRSFVMDLTKIALGWQRKTRLQGGYWQGTFRIEAPLATLMDYFYNWLGWHVEESVLGVKSWEGMIYEMTLNTVNASRTKSLDKLYNHVRVEYVNSAGADQITAAVLEQASIDRYGRREAIEDISKMDSAAAGTMATTYLGEYCWPGAMPQSAGIGSTVCLDVTVCGYIFTAQWRHATTADDSTDTVHDWIQTTLTTDCDTYLLEGRLHNNTSTVVRKIEGYERCWSLMERLVGVGDATGTLLRAYVNNDRYFNYEVVSKTPVYYIVKGMLCSRVEATEAMNPWFVQPGVFRDMDYPGSYGEPSRYLVNVRDILVEEVTVGANSGVTWQSLQLSESAQLAAYLEAATGRLAGSGTTTGGQERTITDAMLAKMGVTRAKWAKLTPAQRRKLKKKL